MTSSCLFANLIANPVRHPSLTPKRPSNPCDPMQSFLARAPSRYARRWLCSLCAFVADGVPATQPCRSPSGGPRHQWRRLNSSRGPSLHIHPADCALPPWLMRWASRLEPSLSLNERGRPYQQYWGPGARPQRSEFSGLHRLPLRGSLKCPLLAQAQGSIFLKRPRMI